MPYCMSKAALDIMVKCLSLDLGPKGIRINSVKWFVEVWSTKAYLKLYFSSPAIIRDNFIARSLGLDFDQMATELAKAGATYPLGRLGEVDDIANSILFLASDDSAFITGQNLCPDGGSTWGGNSEVN